MRFKTLWLLTLIVKLLIAVWLPLSNDEAYYWVWSHHLQLSYFDHPPMVSWLFWLGHWTDFIAQGVRIPAVVLGHCTLLLWYAILKPYLDEKKLTLWLGFILLSPFLGVGSIIVTPDLPLLFFWSLALYYFHRGLLETKPSHYLLLGAALGLGFCAKYHVVLFVPIALLYLVFSDRWRELKWKFIPFAIFTCVLFATPVWLWNMQNDWISFRFQLQHGLQGKIWKPTYPIEYVLGQIALLFPPLLVLLFRRRQARELRWLEAFTLMPLLFFFYTSFKAHAEANWPIVAHPVAHALAFLNDPLSPWIRRAMYFWTAAILIVLSQVAYPWLPVKPEKLKTYEFQRSGLVAKETQAFEPLFTSTYQLAAALSYRQNRMVYKVAGMSRVDFYDFLPMARPTSDVFYIANEWDQPLPGWLVDKGYEMREMKSLIPPIKVFEVTRRAQNAHP